MEDESALPVETCQMHEMNSKLDEIREMVMRIYDIISKKSPSTPTLTDAEIEQINQDNREAIITQILSILQGPGQEFGYVLHSNLLRRVYKKLHGRAPEFSMIINMMKQAGMIEEMMIGKSAAYRLTAQEVARRPMATGSTRDHVQPAQGQTGPMQTGPVWDQLLPKQAKDKDDDVDKPKDKIIQKILAALRTYKPWEYAPRSKLIAATYKNPTGKEQEFSSAIDYMKSKEMIIEWIDEEDEDRDKAYKLA